MTVKAFLSSEPPTYTPGDVKDCPPDCPVSKLVQLGLLQTPHECEKCGAHIVASENT